MSTNGKHTVYIDVDDEITAIIDKVKSAPDKIVALVLPKRATVLQSTVNMKLLKKSATTAKKSLVLITSETGLLPLAGAVGIHVAKSLQSKPEIPAPPDHEVGPDPEISEALEDDEPKVDTHKSVGALAAQAAKKADDDTETIELDDLPAEDDTAAETSTKHQKKKKIKKGLKIPNFDRFRLGIILAIAAVIVLVFGWIVAATILPKATVVIETDTSTTVSKITFTANTAVKDLDLNQGLVPAIQKEVKKTDTEKTTPTGKKDNGTKASGTLTLTNCINDGNAHTIPAGTSFSSGSLAFVTNDAVSLDPALFSGSNCKSANFGLSKDVAVTASKGGTSYNIAASSYTSSISGISASGSAMAGGTTNLVTVVAQGDIDAAVAKMKGRLDQAALTELNQQLQTDNLKGLDDTKVVSEPVIAATPAVGTETTAEVTVTAVTTYNILGVKADFLSQLIKKDVSSKIDTAKQSILDDGLGSAVIRLESRKSPAEVQMSAQALVVAGPQLDVNAIKDEIRGKKRGDAENIISSKPGVKSVDISYKPFWVFSTPRAAKKITITVQKPDVKTPEQDKANDGTNP